MSQILENIFRVTWGLLIRYHIFRSVQEVILGQSMNQTFKVHHNGINMIFSVPNKLTRFRAATFSTKEPETLEWMDSFSDGSVLWDIGANVGTYSIYAAKKSHCVVAFEPSAFNLESLVRNISLNSVSDKVIMLPLPLNDQRGISSMHIGDSSWGGALSCFDKGIGWDGKQIEETYSYRVLGLTIDYVVKELSLPNPDYIKIDVDGIEHFILMGGLETLKTVKSVLVEVNDDFQEQSQQVQNVLKSSGFTLAHKKHSEIFDQGSKFSAFYNQLWVRKEHH